jgi:hypothetical protein
MLYKLTPEIVGDVILASSSIKKQIKEIITNDRILGNNMVTSESGGNNCTCAINIGAF